MTIKKEQTAKRTEKDPFSVDEIQPTDQFPDLTHYVPLKSRARGGDNFIPLLLAFATVVLGALIYLPLFL